MPDAQPSALDDIRVLDLTEDLGGYCTKLLADLGADVIKIEPINGDPARNVPPFYHDDAGPERSLYFFNLNTNKRSVVIDLQSTDGVAAFSKLVATADIVVESFAPGFLDRLGLGYDALVNIRSDIILTSVTGFGQTGPHANYFSSDMIGVAMGGIMWLAGSPDDPPNLPPCYQGYVSAGIQAAAGTMMALYHRDVTGEGQHVDISMQEALLIAQETAMPQFDLQGGVRTRTGVRGALPVNVPGMGPYEASDGWIWSYVGAPGGALWTELQAWMVEEGKAEDLTDDPYNSTIAELNMKFLTSVVLNPESAKEKAPILKHIDDVLVSFYKSKPKWEIYEQGQRRRLLVGIVSDPEDLAKNPQLEAREWFQDIRHDDLNSTLRYPGPPYRLSETPWRVRRRPPLLGEHTDEVLGEIGAPIA